jgi:hypothetical protein
VTVGRDVTGRGALRGIRNSSASLFDVFEGRIEVAVVRLAGAARWAPHGASRQACVKRLYCRAPFDAPRGLLKYAAR